MKYKRIFVLLAAAFLFGACGEEINQTKEVAVAVPIVPEKTTESIPETTVPTVPVEPTAPVPEITPEVTAMTAPTADSTEVIPSPTSTVSPRKEVNPLDGAYWRELYGEENAVLLTAKEISLINRGNFEAEGTGLVKLSETEGMTSADVLRMIESYSFPKQSYYGNSGVTEEIKAEILKNRNTEIPEGGEYIEPAYGILIQNADLRSFPAEKPLTAGKNGRYDYLQETVLLLNEAVVVLHRSLDGKWCFVQAENYFGWIPEASIAYCGKEYMEMWYDAMTDTENPDVLLVTKNVELDAEAAELQLRMGTKLTYEREEDGNFAVYLPVRDEEKRLQFKTCRVSPEDAVYQYLHQGYLPYTRRNVIRLATALLDTPYAWGDALPYSTVYAYDSDIGMDCSSTIGAVYRCFGFVMPRNTGAQRNMVWPGERVSGYSGSERRELLEQTGMGTLLYSPGHVMMYLGEYEGEYYVLHNTTTERLQNGTEEAFYRCVITSMSLGEKGNTIFEAILETKTPVMTEE